MKAIYQFYEKKIVSFQRRLEHIKRRIHLIGTIRLLLVLLAFVCLWIFKNEPIWVLLAITAAFLIPFLVLMFVHTKLFYKREYTEGLISLNENELKGLDYDYSTFDGAKENIDGAHSFGLDLDLFGSRSLFQSINRTVTFGGKARLANWFIHPLTNKQDIISRQEAVKELSGLTELRQHFFVSGTINGGNVDNGKLIQQLKKQDAIFAGNKLWLTLSWAVPLNWALAIGMVCMDMLPAITLVWLFLLYSFATYSQLKKVTKIHNAADKQVKVLSTYALLTRSIEIHPFEAEELKACSAQLTAHDKKASDCIKLLSKYLHSLDQRYNWFLGIFLNAFYLWDIRQCIHIEKWKAIHGAHVEKWFNALAHFDALSSLGSFAYNHPEYTYPEITEKYFSMRGKGLGHPLLPRNICVKNDIEIDNNSSFLIITGANMAGKSTYLRTIGVNYLLACVGAPVCADELTIYPAQLVTSLRTVDSLADNESYFFAELKRLKMIIDRLSTGEELFIILDEILKGTNSIDKQKGSIALMKQLITRRTCGIIATHDLLLGSLANDFPEQVKNFRFEADITNNELTFSYQLRAGVAQNMNACFLMKKMGITV